MTITDTLPEVQALDAAQLRALRHADKVIFRHRDGQSTLEAVKEASRSSDGFEQVIRIPVGTSCTDYSRDASWVPPEERSRYTAFFYFSSAQYDDRAKTLVRFLRAGDNITLHWVRGNSTPALNDAGVVRDELRLHITRGNHREVLLIAVEVGPDNTARMIQTRRF